MKKLDRFLSPDIQVTEQSNLYGAWNNKLKREEMSPKYQSIELASMQTDNVGAFSYIVKYKEMYYLGKTGDKVSSPPCKTKEDLRKHQTVKRVADRDIGL